MKILILYFSGVGATRKVAQHMHTRLSQNYQADIFSVESSDIPNINHYDCLIFGTPTYHAAPAKVIIDYIRAIPPLKKKTPAFVFNTRGLCSLNTNRTLAKELLCKNIITIIDKAYRSPASDGSIIAPFIKRFWMFENNIGKKINKDCATFLALLKQSHLMGYIPQFQLGSILNAPNKAAGQFFTLRIHLHKDICSKCCRCIKHCPHLAFSAGINGYPVFNSKKCENCYRCVHHCPKLALSISKGKKLKRTLNTTQM